MLKDRLLVAVSEYILVLDHSCQVTQGPSDGHLWSAPGVDQVEAIRKRSTLLCRLWWTLGGRWGCQVCTKKYAPAISRGLKLTFSGDCLSGTCTLVTASGLSDKALFPTWFFFFFRSCPDEHWYRTQVLDYPHCWALGSGGRGAVWDLSAGKIVSYFGSNDRCSPNYSCFDNFSYYTHLLPQEVLGTYLEWSVSTNCHISFSLLNLQKCVLFQFTICFFWDQKFTFLGFWQQVKPITSWESLRG